MVNKASGRTEREQLAVSSDQGAKCGEGGKKGGEDDPAKGPETKALGFTHLVNRGVRGNPGSPGVNDRCAAIGGGGGGETVFAARTSKCGDRKLKPMHQSPGRWQRRLALGTRKAGPGRGQIERTAKRRKG